MTQPRYGVTHRGRALRAGAQPDTWEVEVTSLAENRALGPFESTISTLEVGDRVLLTQVGLSLSDLVIVGKLPPDPPSATLPITIADVTGLAAALAAAQPLDTDLTAIASLAPADDDVFQRKAGGWTNRTLNQLKVDLALALADVSGLVAALAGKQPLDADLTTIAGLTATTDSVLQAKAGAWSARTLAQLATDLSTLLQPLDSDLTTIAGLTATTDSVLQAKVGAWAARTLTQLATDLSTLLQPLDADLTAIAAIAAANDDIIQRVSGAWTNRTMAQVRVTLNPPRAELRQTVSQSLTTGAFTSVAFDTEDKDTAAAHSTITNTSRYTLPLTGDYLVAGATCFASSAGFKAVRFALSGTAVAGSQADATSATGAQWPVASRTMIIAGTAGQYLELQAFHDIAVLSTGVSADVQSTMTVLYVG